MTKSSVSVSKRAEARTSTSRWNSSRDGAADREPEHRQPEQLDRGRRVVGDDGVDDVLYDERERDLARCCHECEYERADQRLAMLERGTAAATARCGAPVGTSGIVPVGVTRAA